MASTHPFEQSEQLVVAVSSDWNESSVTVTRYERADGAWVQSGESIAAELGHAGLGWGIGLHGTGAPTGMSGPAKKEGDGRSPAGAFRLGDVFGYGKTPPSGTKAGYTTLDSTWRCVDDSKSGHYNDVLAEPSASKVDWKSAETMKRSDELYRWVVLVDHNSIGSGASEANSVSANKPTPGAGSCIFFHVWRKPGGATVGCAAMDRGHLETLIAWLDPKKQPVTVMLPKAEYVLLKDTWKLPPLSRRN